MIGIPLMMGIPFQRRQHICPGAFPYQTASRLGVLDVDAPPSTAMLRCSDVHLL